MEEQSAINVEVETIKRKLANLDGNFREKRETRVKIDSKDTDSETECVRELRKLNSTCSPNCCHVF